MCLDVPVRRVRNQVCMIPKVARPPNWIPGVYGCFGLLVLVGAYVPRQRTMPACPGLPGGGRPSGGVERGLARVGCPRGRYEFSHRLRPARGGRRDACEMGVAAPRW